MDGRGGVVSFRRCWASFTCRRDAFSVSKFFHGLVKAACSFSAKSESSSFERLVVRDVDESLILLKKQWT